jgi:hypothetical protein|tara:strand:+ start:657 stop:950 length:294 start_codon:yes stop_codon:yes gene_type:complete
MKNPKELLKPIQIQIEYGIKPRALAYMRELSDDAGELVGPLWINPKDTEIFYYKREWIEAWIQKDTFKPDVPPLQSQQSKQNEPKTSNIHKFQKPTT